MSLPGNMIVKEEVFERTGMGADRARVAVTGESYREKGDKQRAFQR